MKQQAWHSYHLFYHGSRSRLITEAVKPAIGGLLAQRHVDRFFFVRYNLGGPHVRLRLLASVDRSSIIRETLASAAETFFARHPSTSSIPHDTIRRVNQTILATDPVEQDDSIYPNHSLHEFTFRPETERYGGLELLGHSLDFFAVSSLEALRFLGDHAAGPRGQQMAAISLILIRQALGFAETSEEFCSLLEYPMDTWGTPLSDFVARGDEAFQRQRDHLRELLHREVARFLNSPLSANFEPAHRFRWEIHTADEKTLRCIKSSQMHMTANRLGLSNPEEVYLSRLLSRTARDLADSDPGLWRTLEQCLVEGARDSGSRSRLPELLTSALKTAFPPPVDPPIAVSPGPRKEYGWTYFVARHSAAGQGWAEEYQCRCGDAYQETRKSLELLRKRQITAGREALRVARARIEALGALPPSFAHVMDRWYYGALAYYFYCVSKFDAALDAIDQANEAVEAAIGCEPLLLPFAQTCHEFPLHKARIAYLRGRWREARMQIGLAWQALHDERPLCILADGTAIYFSRIIEFHRQINSLDADEEASLQSVFDEETRRKLFEHIASGIYATPVIPYP